MDLSCFLFSEYEMEEIPSWLHEEISVTERTRGWFCVQMQNQLFDMWKWNENHKCMKL